MLLTGIAPMYMRRSMGAGSGDRGEAALDALWWPPTKVAGRYLSPYLALAGSPGRGTLQDRSQGTHDQQSLLAANRQARELARSFADADAEAGDVRSALRWLDIVERLDGVLSATDAERREAWRTRLRAA